MLIVIQRVSQASVEITSNIVGSIQQGIAALIAIEPEDSERTADKAIDKITSYRIFSDQNNKMNLSVKDIQGELLLIPQFTLTADTQKGLRPNFSNCAPPDKAQKLFEYLICASKKKSINVQSGIFAADMSVHLTNDGPVTFILHIK